MAIFRRIVTSLVNQIKPLTVTRTSGTLVANYPVDNLKTPEEPYTPAKVGVVGEYAIIDIDRGASGTALPYIGVSRVNFSPLLIRGSNDPAFGTNPYSVSRVVPRSPLNGRYNYAEMPTTPVFNYRYLRIVAEPPVVTIPESMLPAQTNFLFGGIWMGTIVYPPINWLWDVEFEPIYPRKKIAPDDDSWEQTLITGNQRLRIRGKKIARTHRQTPSTSDELARYMEYDRSLFEDAEFFALCLNSGDPSCALVVRNNGDRVTWNRPTRNHMESSFELVEVIRP